MGGKFGQPDRGWSVIDVHDDLAAALADRYEVERELGHGGMAIVYLARDVKHGRRVAVKVLRPDLASSVGAERFLREIGVAAKLTHPNILSLHDSGSAPGGLLYYVMPYVEGETLRDRLDREHQLPIDDALSIARQVGDALDYAHAHGVVHRDVKPENILLMGEHVLVADFGLARALFSAGSTRLTESAVTVGTPAYMSPEQAAADPEVDGRADVYSLACVLYEMIAGTPPFRGATAQAVLAQHLTASAPSICAHRPHCPKAVDAAVQRAMEKVPADRFRTAREFVEAMEATASTATPGPEAVRGLTPSRRAIALVAAAVVVGVAAVVASRFIGPHADTDPDTYVVLPFSGLPDGAAPLDQPIAESLAEWQGVHVVDPRRTSEVVGGPGVRSMTMNDALRAARELGAGRLVWGEATRVGDSLRLRVAAYDTHDGRELRTARATLRTAETPSAPHLRALVNDLLRDRSELPWARSESDVAPSLEAWRAYDRGRTALSDWDITRAQKEFQSAVRRDPEHAQAWLWLSLTELWSGDTTQRWRGATRRAFELHQRLTTNDSVVADAELALAERRYTDAGERFSALTKTDTTGVIGWYGLGESNSRDPVVVRDARSPSGYRFRGSVEQAKRAYLHILDDRAPPQPAFVYTRLASVLTTSGSVLKVGRLVDGSAYFGAFQSWQGDSLTHVPYPLASVIAAGPGVSTRAKAAAIDRNRALLRRLYVDWTRSTPSSAEAHEALAALLEATEELSGGDAGSAIDEIRRARSLTTDSATALELARDELRLLVKTAAWDAASALADTLFAKPVGDADSSLVGAAALTGRVGVLAEILRAHPEWADLQATGPDGTALDVPQTVQEDAAEMLGYGSLGLCNDRLRAMPTRVRQQLERYVPDERRRAQLRGALLRRPLTLAVPCLGARAVESVDAEGEPVLLMEHALASGRLDSVRAIFRRIPAARHNERPGDVAPDYTYLESWLMAAAGDTAAAVAHLDGTLEALPTLGNHVLDFPAQSAGLVRAIVLRADLAAAAGDSATAQRWARAAAALLSRADRELRPTVERMRSIASSNH